MSYNSEKSFVDEVEECLKENGCKTWREVIPDGCESWDKPFRVDLIFFREDFGFVGVEAKNINSLRSGKDVSNAIDQINNKYRRQSYFKGNLIDKWAIILPQKTGWIDNEHDLIITQEVTEFIKNFIHSRYDIELLDYSPKIKYSSGIRTARVVVGAFTHSKIKIGGEFIKHG